MAITYYAPQLPLQTDDFGNFIFISDIKQQIRQKVRMLVLTNPGEKIMMPNFGVGVKRFLFENENANVQYNTQSNFIVSIKQTQTSSLIEEAIRTQVATFLPDIFIKDIQVNIENQTLFLGLYYTYRNIVTDRIEITVSL